MISIAIDELRAKTDSLFKLTILAGLRAQELSAGSNKLVEAKTNEKSTIIALKEIMQDKITFKLRDKKG